MTAPQNNPRIKFGLSLAKPLASTVPQGMIYVYTDALLLGVVAVNGPTGWVDTADNLRLSQTQGGPGVTVAGTALITPPRPFDPAGAINVTKFGPPGATASVVLQIVATTPGLDFTVNSLDAAGVIVNEAVLFFWSTTPV